MSALGEFAANHHQAVEIGISAFTLGVSFWIAFGPLRHRLPRFLTRFAKLSATLKLLGLAGICVWGLANNIRHDDSLAVRWLLSVLAIALVAGAGFVATRKTAAPPKHAETGDHPKPGA